MLAHRTKALIHSLFLLHAHLPVEMIFQMLPSLLQNAPATTRFKCFLFIISLSFLYFTNISFYPPFLLNISHIYILTIPYSSFFLHIFSHFLYVNLQKGTNPKWICAFLVSLSLILFLFFFLLQLLPRRLPITLQLLSFPMLSYLQLSHCHFHHYFLLR